MKIDSGRHHIQTEQTYLLTKEAQKLLNIFGVPPVGVWLEVGAEGNFEGNEFGNEDSHFAVVRVTPGMRIRLVEIGTPYYPSIWEIE